MIQKYRAYRRARRSGLSAVTPVAVAVPRYMTLDCRDGVHGACFTCRCDCHVAVVAAPAAEEVFDYAEGAKVPA
ncbi:hypothetical protein BIU82_14755 [Arthrobacter sp. SW1]|uniref:hypothetical protein n=1 Tax=Arthrobacter sp. SW1 TaxID=1920889 RepID=UPI000877B7CB|nr:hypothetical protein [Arthrobacter sp. SW1]OFI39346.1 hypothetical protein BIU82_14755 [Arthrobacter sp. SW1]